MGDHTGRKEKEDRVVGAGPVGLQAAWILAKRGHEVKVYEKEITGRGAVPPGSSSLAMKQELAKTISTYLTFCKKYGAEVIYGVKATKEMLEQEGF